MDYELFVLQFQRRTQKRMADFEAMMREHQNKMEQTAKHYARARETMERPKPVAPRGDYTLERSRVSAARRARRAQVHAVLQSQARGTPPEQPGVGEEA
ncbi:hypothetical protein SAMN04488531_1463 [Corynebacterium coyleae]|nr:hypothetical protein HMPREF2785_03765 [Corynebacterium sp. HMSC067D03]OFL92265.1 hypothetical protein HMPREF2734_09165 [Corynebacterium sp. HMSC055D05]OFO35868.1 hypothetical protein HMPREF3048_01975 [Corynebacterium sp. HMSC075D04]OFT31640.1 hypothetical protein HMPREF3171_01985 [Corynebacterium sp. HMSC08F01]OFT68876.1 hypothetical protein HMPREF3145_08300 [Corynebacterium sp. HMSC05C01]OFU57416.1 hypothetical protein HMPREF3120_02475 [Corynebacterium sp. HMSC11D10]OHO29503.1 hypothetica